MNLFSKSSQSGQHYVGQTNEKHRRHGRGVLSYANGDSYDGEFKNNLRHGTGTHKYASGHVYTVIYYLLEFV